MKLRKGFAGLLYLVTFGLKFEVSIEFGDGFVALLKFLCDVAKDEVRFGILGHDLDRVFGALIGGVEVAAVFVELRYAEIFGDAVVVGAWIDLWELVAGGPRAGGLIDPWG